ncbi:PASTA domain-containing protein [Streptomyces sp. NPDC016469]|uniref:PASTA domain-containing protein n=1 Tax=Streptomyces sp. NPDC016469 TaxID=3157191 RepID=UPI0033C35505
MNWNNSTQQPWGPAPEKPSGPASGLPAWARKRVVVPAAVGLFVAGAVAGSAGAGGSGTENVNSATPAPLATVTVTASPKAGATADAEPPAPKGTTRPADDDTGAKVSVPDFVGMGLQSAQDAAQAKGFSALTSHDSAGRDRMQLLDRNWKVCSQNVAAGTSVPTTTELDFGAVKTEESCPAKDRKPTEAVGGRMPDFAGTSVNTARNALDSGTSLTVKDAAEDRMVLLESNWKVCTQVPAAGTKLNGQPVELTAVKFEENCP